MLRQNQSPEDFSGSAVGKRGLSPVNLDSKGPADPQNVLVFARKDARD